MTLLNALYVSAKTDSALRKVRMDYSTLAQHVAQDRDGVVFDVHSLYAHLRQVKDWRARRGRRYELAVILTALVLAKMAGEDTPSGIAAWARERVALFDEVFGLPRLAMPSHNTYRRALKRALRLADLERELDAYVQTWPEVGTEVRLTLDGKTLRGTIAFGETRGVHLLAAYLPGLGVVLFQVAVDTKTNEIGAAPQVLKMLDLQGKIVTGDAMFAQRALSLLIVQAGGDYVWTVKDNQSQLKTDIEQLFANDQGCVPGFSPAPMDFRTARTVNSGHGRIETRTLTTSSLLAETCDWPGAQQVFKLERKAEIVAHGQTRAEVVYGITSLTAVAADPARLLTIVREHWGQENGLHYRRDVTFHEDAGRTLDWTVAEAIAILNNLVLALLLRGGHMNAAQRRRHYAAHPDEALKCLLAAPT
jgi:predicted transposase YbfD/YdcC